jgi:hypothetical protein
MPDIPLLNGFYESDSLPLSNQRLVNWRVNIPQTTGAFSQASLFGTEGLTQALTTGLVQSINRNSHVKSDLPYFVNGENVYRVELTVTDGVETFNYFNLGSIAGDSRVSMADNGKQLMIVAEGRGWIIDETSGTPFVEITAPGFTANGVPQQVKFVDSYFLVTTDTKKFIRSDSNDGLVWNALNSYTAEADPDPIVAPIIFKNQAFIAGTETIEAYQNAAGIFQRISGMIINKGVFAPFGIVLTSDSFMFIGGGVNESPAIWASAGSSVQKVSTTAIDNKLSSFSSEEIEAAFTYSYSVKGAYIVGFTFPRITFEYNTITQKWNERQSRVTSAKGVISNDRWRANSLVTAFNKVLVGDAQDGRIGVLDANVYDEYGAEILRGMSTVHIQDNNKSFSIPNIEATMESGVGTTDLDPILRLSTSKNGKTFNNERFRNFGKIGEYETREIWRRNGRFPRMAVLKLEMSDKVKPSLLRLTAKIKQGLKVA